MDVRKGEMGLAEGRELGEGREFEEWRELGEWEGPDFTVWM